MNYLRSLPLFLVVAAACGGKVGSSDGSTEASSSAPPASTAPPAPPAPQYDPAACPTTRGEADAVRATTEAELRAASIGRWVSCHAERYYTGTGELPGMWNGARGIEFAEEGGQWTYYYLHDDLSRDTSPKGHGHVMFVDCQPRNPTGCQVQLLVGETTGDADMNLLFWQDGFRDWLYDHYEFARAR
jgi:hypothetical protein